MSTSAPNGGNSSMEWLRGCVRLRGLSTAPVAWEWETACDCLSAAVRGEEDLI